MGRNHWTNGMTRAETNTVLNILRRIKDPDAHVKEAILICEKQLAIYDKRLGQIRDHYEPDPFWVGR